MALLDNDKGPLRRAFFMSDKFGANAVMPRWECRILRSSLKASGMRVKLVGFDLCITGCHQGQQLLLANLFDA